MKAARKRSDHEGDDSAASTAPNGSAEQTQGQLAGTEGEGDGDNQISAPVRMSNEVMPCVGAAATTITGCSDAEVKNYASTADYVCRQIAIQLADIWKDVCRTSTKASKDGEKAAKAVVNVKIDIDHTNLAIMDTKVKTTLPQPKVERQDSIQEDLRQVQFQLSA